MSNSVGDIFLDLKLNTKPYEKTLSSLGKGANTTAVGRQINDGISKGLSSGSGSLMGLASTLGGNWGAMFGKVAGAAIVVKLTKFISKSLELNSAFHAASDMAQRAFPTMSGEVEEFTKTCLYNFGLSETSALKLASTFGVMANSMGMSEAEAWEMSKTLTALSGDMASFYHISVEEAQGKLEGIFSGQTRSLRSLGIVMSEASLSQFALAQGFGKTYNEMTELEKVQLRYLFVLDRTKLAQGDALRYAHAYGNEVRKLKQNFEQLQISVGEGFRGIVTPILTWLNMILVKLAQIAAMWSTWIKRIQAPFKPLKGIGDAIRSAIGGSTTEVVQDLDDSVAGVSDSVGGVGDSAKGAKKQIKELRRELLGFDKIVKLTKQDTDSGTSGDVGAGGVGGLGGLGGLDIGSSYVDDYDTSFLENIKIPPALEQALEKLGNAFAKLFGVLKDAGRWVLDNVLRPLGKWLAEKFIPVVIRIIAPFVEAFALRLRVLLDIIRVVWEVIKPIVAFLGDVLIWVLEKCATQLEGVMEVLNWAYEKILRPFFAFLIEAIQTVWDKIRQVVKRIKRSRFIGQVLKFFKELKRELGKAILTLMERLYKALQTVGKALDKIFGEGTAKKFGLDISDEDIEDIHNQIEKLNAEPMDIDLRGVVFAIEDAVPAVQKVIKNLSGSIEKVKNQLPTSSKTLTGFTASISKKADNLSDAGHTIINMIASFSKKKDALSATNKTIKEMTASFKYRTTEKGFSAAITGMVASFSDWTKGSGFSSYLPMIAYLKGVEISSTAENILRAFKADGGVYSAGRWHPIQQYASGGNPNRGQLFVAREAGPELVGTLGGHTAVMNNDQIVASVSAGVARAISNIKFIAKNATPRVATGASTVMAQREVQSDNAEVIGLLKTLIQEVKKKDTTVNLDGRTLTRVVVNNMNQQTRMTGTSPLLI